MHSTIVNSLVVDKIAGLDDYRLLSDFRLASLSSSSSDDSFTKYSMMNLNGGEAMESVLINDDADCPCLLPPPDFDVGPPPKPFFLGDDGDDPFRVDFREDDDSCPLDWPGFVSNTIVPNERTSVNEPLIFIITATAVMALALIIFTISLIWCQRKGWCKRTSKLSATFSSDTEESTAGYSTGVARKTEWSFNSMMNGGEKKLPQPSNLGILMYGGQADQQRQTCHPPTTNGAHFIAHRPLPSLPRATLTPSFPRRPQIERLVPAGSNSLNNRPRRYLERDHQTKVDQNDSHLYDSHNPVYEEISLSGFDQQCPIHSNGNQRFYVGTASRPETAKVTGVRTSASSSLSSSSESPCSCQSCGKSASLDNMELELEVEEEENLMISPSPKRKVSTINQSTQSEETFLNNDEENYCECATNNGRESGYGTEGYPARDVFGTWDSPKRVSPPDDKNVIKNFSSKKRPQQQQKSSATNSNSSLWVTTSDDKSKRSGNGPFAVFSGPNSAYV